MNPFPIPVVAYGPGTQVEDETLDYMSMPQGMETYRPPLLPEPEELASREAAHRVLREVLAAVDEARHGGVPQHVSLEGLSGEDLALVNQVLGEGEVSARVHDEERPQAEELRVQESVFAGVWRVMLLREGRVADDWIEVGSIPQALRQAARDDAADVARRPMPVPPGPNVLNATSLLDEVRDRVPRWRVGQSPHVINLTLLPVSSDDIAWLDHHLGTGRVVILSRGYGNCRITNTRTNACWRVVYYNSQDAVILNTVEVGDLPDVACAAMVDLHDSHERLVEVLQWVEAA
jgi:hydrogenase-1 operon protein HyaF